MTSTLNRDGLLRSSPDTIFTYGGGMIRPLDPDPADLDIQAIAHALGNLCRWTGHVTQFYSVAEHCVLAARMVPEGQRLACLLHDASEAYLADLARPIKKAEGLGEVYLAVEAKLEEAIALRFGTAPPPMSKEIKFADDALLKREAQRLVPHLGAIMPAPPEGTPELQCWMPTVATAHFLAAFEQCGGVA